MPEYVLPGSALLEQEAKDFAKAFPSIQSLRKQAQAVATGKDNSTNKDAGQGGAGRAGDTLLTSAAKVPPDLSLQPYVSHRWAQRQ